MESADIFHRGNCSSQMGVDFASGVPLRETP
jgi:hypothetical protein